MRAPVVAQPPVPPPPRPPRPPRPPPPTKTPPEPPTLGLPPEPGLPALAWHQPTLLGPTTHSPPGPQSPVSQQNFTQTLSSLHVKPGAQNGPAGPHAMHSSASFGGG